MTTPPPIPLPGQPVTCPRCGATNAAGANFCESCGHRLNVFPTTSSDVPPGPPPQGFPLNYSAQGRAGPELDKQMKRAAYTLLAVGILGLIAGVVFAILANNPQIELAMDPRASAISFLVGGVMFIALFFWARRSPLPATIVGLIIYLTILSISVVAAMAAMREGEMRGLGVGCLDIVIIILLVQGIQAAVKHRRLREEQGKWE